jgi:hypothetical protein
MRKRSREQETRDQECRDRAGRNVGVAVCDVVQHAEVEERVGETEDAAGDDGGPVACFAVAGEGEPEQAYGEEPDGDQVGEEAGFGAALAAVLEAVAFVEVGLW